MSGTAAGAGVGPLSRRTSEAERQTMGADHPSIQSNWTRGRKWAVLGTVVGTLMALVGIAAMIALQNGGLAKGYLDFLKPMNLYGAIPAMAVGAGLAMGAGFYLHRTKYLPQLSEMDANSIAEHLEEGEFFICQNEVDGKIQLINRARTHTFNKREDLINFLDGKDQKGKKELSLRQLKNRAEKAKKEHDAQTKPIRSDSDARPQSPRGRTPSTAGDL